MKDKVDINTMKQSWKDLGFKDRLSYIFAIGAFVAGWTFCAVGFWTEPVGTVSDSVLWILGQALLFVGAIIGIGQYYSQELSNFKRSVIQDLKGRHDGETEVETDESE